MTRRSRRFVLSALDAGGMLPGQLAVAAILSDRARVAPPVGWREVPDDMSITPDGTRLQIFYRIPVPLGSRTTDTSNYTFTSPVPQAITGSLLAVVGARQTDPIAAAATQAQAVPSLTVPAASLLPLTADSQLVFVGAARSPVGWQTPSGMAPVVEEGHSEVRFAYQRWPSVATTGVRTALVSSPVEGIGGLVAVANPPPLSCPAVHLVSRPQRIPGHRGARAIVLHARDQRSVSVRLRCDWTAPCVGALAADPLLPNSVAHAQAGFRIAPGQTANVTLTFCGACHVLREAKPRLLEVDTDLVLRMSNGQFVDSFVPGDARQTRDLYLEVR